MRTYVVGMVLLAATGGLLGQPPGERVEDRVARLITQLGHAEFARRDAATRELDAIGEPALGALRKAAASSDDAEIRRRAERILVSITARVRAAVTKKELEKLQGTWIRVAHETNGQRVNGEDHIFTVKGDKWTTHLSGQLLQGGTVANIEVKEAFHAIDLPITEGSNVGVTARSIYAIEGDSLSYVNSGEPRATDFTTKPGDGRTLEFFRRAKPGEKPRPAEVRYVSAPFSTDLIVPENKKAIHRVALTCRPADGEAATLTLDPTEVKLDAFGDLAVADRPAPVVSLECKLKLVRAEKDRQLYQLSGPKVVSRFSLVVFGNMTPSANSRLLVHGPGEEVRYAIDMSRPELHFPPCHPGCFPAGTMVHLPDGSRAIERIREGDRVTAVDAHGKASPAKVTHVFVTRNRVLEVRTDGGTLVTTTTQPIVLEGGGFREAGELKKGDRIWRWVKGERRVATVAAVTAAGREAEVFNLILGEPTAFIAGGFLVRSKPPAVALLPRP